MLELLIKQLHCQPSAASVASGRDVPASLGSGPPQLTVRFNSSAVGIAPASFICAFCCPQSFVDFSAARRHLPSVHRSANWTRQG
ncbi:hypothetical protein BS17DRAFT_578168 [Gyrodon lividus]|nr:hypothetical protein BS17DRAFT_578168 [Gyrodon lividus]